MDVKRLTVMRKKNLFSALFLGLIFIAFFAVCCMINYSDGDDAFFLNTISKHSSFSDFVVYLTGTMNGRIGATMILWIVFSRSIWIWRILNALVMTAYVYFMSRTVCLINREITILNATIISAGSFGIMSIGVLGYSCLWITGSINYLWPLTFAFIGLQPIISTLFYARRISYLEILVCSVFGLFSCIMQEQIAAVMLGITVAASFAVGFCKRRMPLYQLIMLFLILCAIIWLLLCPVTRERSVKEIAKWFPEYSSLSFGQHFFVTIQWMAHSLAHDLRYAMLIISSFIAVSLIRTNRKILSAFSWLLSIICIVPAMLPKFKDVGLENLNFAKKVVHTPKITDLTQIQLLTMIFWIIVAVAMFAIVILYFKGTGHKVVSALIFSAGIASFAIMYFSPTIYASGSRTLFVCAAMFVLLSQLVVSECKKKIIDFKYVVVTIIIALMQVFENRSDLMAYLK